MNKLYSKNGEGIYALCLGEVPTGFCPIGHEEGIECELSLTVEDAVLFLANLCIDPEKLDNVCTIIDRHVDQFCARSDCDFISSLDAHLIKVVGKRESTFLSSIVYSMYEENQSNSKNVDSSRFSERIAFRGACGLADTYLDCLLSSGKTEGQIIAPRDKIIRTLAMASHAGVLICKHFPLLGYVGDKFTVVDVILPRDFVNVVNLGTLQIIESETVVRKCRNCGNFFIPSNRADEVYCDPCKSVSYDEKIKSDAILWTYRKIYKTQNARKQRNPQIINISARFQRWNRFAKTKLLECQRGDISLQEMESIISDDGWMREGTSSLDSLRE